MLVFLDEAGFNLAMTRFYARSHADERAFSIKQANISKSFSACPPMATPAEIRQIPNHAGPMRRQ